MLRGQELECNRIGKTRAIGKRIKDRDERFSKEELGREKQIKNGVEVEINIKGR